jgi:hypothetical protein
MPKIPEKIKKALEDILRECKREDFEIYKAQIKEWKKLEEYWHGVQYLFWSERDQTWLSTEDINTRKSHFLEDDDEGNGPYYDYVLNIYRAHGEAIISALSAQLPTLRWVPDDADDSLDLLTARTKSKIGDLVQRHNNAAMIYLKGMFFLWNGGIVASYRYKDADLKYGTYTVPAYGMEERPTSKKVCPTCGYEQEAGDAAVPDSMGGDGGVNPERDVQALASSPVGLQEYAAPATNICPQCGSEMKEEEGSEQVPVQTGTKVLSKTRVKLRTFGPLSFKIPYHATNQDECDYLLLFLDSSKSNIKATLQPDFKESELTKTIDSDTIESVNRFSRTGYLYPDDPGMNTRDLSTITQAWFRPSRYWLIDDEKVRIDLFKRYPSGVHCTFVGKLDTLVDNDVTQPEDESLDKKWEIGQAGLSTYIHSDPIGKPLISVNDMENQLANLTMDTIDHSNPASFAEADVLNFDQYGKTESAPGYMYKAKAKQGQPLAASFHTLQRTTLSKEVPMFKNQLDQAGQFLVGSFPSIYGGPSEGKSRTFSEYQQSRAMALQRLMIVQKYAVDWWKRTVGGAVDIYAETVVEDQKFAQFQDGKYVNVWIRQSELLGKTGGVESESSESFPVSSIQKNALLMKFIELNNPFINSALYTPENARNLQDNLALNEFKIPGEAQRYKQAMEIDELSNSQPIDMMNPSVPIDPDVDDHAVHIATIKSLLVDPIGLDMKKTNPAGYLNCILHMKLHQNALMMQTLTMQHTAPPGVEPPSAEGAPE